MKHIVFFLTAALLLNASCGSSDEGGKTDPPAAPVPVAPTTELGKADEAIENLQLKPGKLISINQVNAANCRRAVAAGMCIDIMASDKIVFASDMTDERLDGLFAECGEAIRSTKADFWGLHLPYQTYDISSTNENTRVTAVLKLKRLIELTIEHLRPQHFVIHPNTGTILTTGGDFAERTAQSRKSLAELQRHIESCNAQHGTKAILCVENCARSLAYDGDSLLDLLDAEGLERYVSASTRVTPSFRSTASTSTPCATATHSTCSAASAPVWEPCTSSRTRAHSIRPIPRTSTSNPSPAD